MLFRLNDIVEKIEGQREKYYDPDIDKLFVHPTLVLRAIELLKPHYPECADLYSDMLDTLVEFSGRPDCRSDYEKGTGRHYYCSMNALGLKMHTSHGYFKNGVFKYAKSARSMLEEDYTMALTMFASGEYEAAAEFFGRAIHMVSDMSCLPHATGMTYFSPLGKVHKAYERLAGALYPEHVPPQKITPDKLDMFSDRRSFARALNKLVVSQRREVALLEQDPVRELRYRLRSAERSVASLMVRFWQDTKLPSEKAHYIRSGMKYRLFGKITAEAEISATGIRFTPVGCDDKLAHALTIREFYAAHRGNGFFTLTPVSDLHNGRIFCSDGKLRSFDPSDKKQLFRLV